MPVPITASILYDLIHCPQRVSLDLFGDPVRKDPVNPFVELLWERGNLYEQQVVSGLKIPFLDLSRYGGEEKERLTREAMQRGEPLIYGGRIHAGELLGDPDLLRREGAAYVPGDIKSGAGEEGDEENSRLKKHYGVQLALYVDILERLKLATARRGFIWDVHDEEVPYDLSAALGPKTPQSMWDIYTECLAEAKEIVVQAEKPRPAYGAVYKQCHWYTACLDELTMANDLTLLPELGRSKRDVLASRARTITELARLDVSACLRGKKTIFEGIGPDALVKFKERAALVVSSNPRPYLKHPVTFPAGDVEIFFDIEVDPMRDVCYLHGFVERHARDNASEGYIACFADEPTAEAEEAAFTLAWAYLQGKPEAAIYYYSKYERTIWRKLQAKYPGVCTAEEVEALFARAIDLYFDVVRKHSEWPTKDFSIKTLAKYLGFAWRDAHPSGAASIEWFDRWIQNGDGSIKQRILEYNEDDCRATRVLLDGLRGLPVRGAVV
ncbi:MAG: TM0106 family RecB-like putative nuclease [Sulfuricaulis sp.]